MSMVQELIFLKKYFNPEDILQITGKSDLSQVPSYMCLYEELKER